MKWLPQRAAAASCRSMSMNELARRATCCGLAWRAAVFVGRAVMLSAFAWCLVSSAGARAAASAFEGRSTAFYYGSQPPEGLLSQFDRLVLEPDNVTPDELQTLRASGAAPFAYLSIGELGEHRRDIDTVEPEWVLGLNSVWNSRIMDLGSDGWQNFLLERVDTLVDAGYVGLFLDTMDSYRMTADSDAVLQRQEEALVAFLGLLAKRHPGLRLIANRGFEVLEQVAPYLEAVAAESLYASWNNATGEYVAVSPRAREWLLGRLREARQAFGLDVIVIDYLPPNRRDEARQLAEQIAELDFIPWVSTPAFDYVGVGAFEAMPREILMLYDSRSDEAQESSRVHKLLATPLEYLGYVPVYHDVARETLPAGELVGRFAGVVSWIDEPRPYPALARWMERQFESGLPMALFGSPGVGVTPALAAWMGVRVTPGIDPDTARVRKRDALIGNERELPLRVDGFNFSARSVDPENTVHLRYGDAFGRIADFVVTGDWGGYALDPMVISVDLDDTTYWRIDPFAFLVEALDLQPMPMPDVTTEAGNRTWFAHIDGDALPSWAEMPGSKLGAEIIRERILERYPLPHTVSIVEGEINGVAVYADRRARMVKVAREIFALPQVEIASHTYSHPFRWRRVSKQDEAGEYNLPIPGYEYSTKREVDGSANFIDEVLAPAGKQTQVFLWSGDALPGTDALAAAERRGLANLNGGNTVITRARPALGHVTPMARTVGDHVQVYAPIMNENVYTNDWLGPYDGFRRVIETLEMTDRPRRLRPLNIYYHFYAGTKIASLRSLEDVYAWSVTQDINPVHASDYARRVPAFRRAGVGRYLDGVWKLSALGGIRSIRLLGTDTFADLGSATGLAGQRSLHDGVYLHTDGADTVHFRTSSLPSESLHLVSANGRIEAWDSTGGRLSFRVRGHVPVVLELGGSLDTACNIESGGERVRGERTRTGSLRFEFMTRDTGNAVFSCPA